MLLFCPVTWSFFLFVFVIPHNGCAFWSVKRGEKVVQLALLLGSREYPVVDPQIIFSNFFPNPLKRSMVFFCNICQTIMLFFNFLDPFPF